MEQIQEISKKITRQAMQEELGENYKKCWAFAFKYASEETDIDTQVEKLENQFDLIKPQAEWFITGAKKILAKSNKAVIEAEAEKVQAKLPTFSTEFNSKPQVDYVSQMEMMSFLSDIAELLKDSCFLEYWADLEELKQNVIESNCTTENEVLRLFKIKAKVEGEQEEKERFYNAYPVSTDGWDNGYFDVAGTVDCW